MRIELINSKDGSPLWTVTEWPFAPRAGETVYWGTTPTTGRVEDVDHDFWNRALIVSVRPDREPRKAGR